MVLAVALLGGILPRAASADGPFALSTAAAPYAVCPEAEAGKAECMAIRVPTVSSSSADATGPDLEGGGELGGFNSKELREAYKLPETGGSSQTVALVDAYNDPYAESDLQKYREKYKDYFKGTETACTETNGCFKKVNQSGETKNYPESESGWSGEISLDVDMVSSACPECHILLVEASNEEVSDLMAANEEAVKLKATEVSNSWGSLEFSGETSDDKYLDHPGIPILAAAGDVKYDGCDHKRGAGVCYPADSRYVIAVGGTKLTKESAGSRKWKEAVWYTAARESGTGSGCSKYETKPPWQTDKGCTKRTDNDVAADASIESPVSVCDSYISGCWEDFGGTSASSPFVAGVDALATSATKLLAADAFYKKPSMLFHVSEGSNGECGSESSETYYLCHATKEGYNGPTGEGTPDGVFESAAAAAATGLATKVKITEATLNGLVNPNGLATKYYLEYGTTESYGKKTEEVSAGSGTSNLEESKTITGLTGNTTYHYRVVATNSNGTTYGLDEVFTTATGWSIQETPSLSSSAFLYGVSCTSSAACIAVGTGGLAERWNGTEWKVQTTPNTDSLHAVSCVSSTACTAVGSQASGTLAESWNGTEWIVQSTPDPSEATHSYLEAVSCTSSTECTATGWYEKSSGKRYTLAERWNGTEWKIQATLSPGEGEPTVLTGVSCTSSTSCEASGFYYKISEINPMAERWNGTEWTLQKVPKPIEKNEAMLEAISCTSSTVCTATGRYGNPGYTTLAERFNGTEWASQSIPNPTGQTLLYGVSCVSSVACTTAGVTYLSEELVTLAEGWNGTEWTIQTTPNPAEAKENVLYGVSCTSSTVCVAVGYYRKVRGTGAAIPLVEFYS